MIDEEIRQTLEGDPGALFHDDLAPINDAFYVRDFVARAEGHRLQFLGDAQPHVMFDTRSRLDWVKGGLMEREQYFDFLCLRPFRQTLLCRNDVQLQRPPVPARMDGFLFSSPARASEGQIEGLHSVCIKSPAKPVAKVAAAMGAVFPRPVSFEKLLEIVKDREALRGILFAMISSGFAALHKYGLPPAANSRPVRERIRWPAMRAPAPAL